MNIIKVTTINDDGSVNFEGYYGPEEVRFVLELGTNFLLTQGANADYDEEEDDDEDDDVFEVEGPDSLQ
jgi:hypothetical protein